MSEIRLKPGLKTLKDKYQKEIECINNQMLTIWFTKKVNYKLVEFIKKNDNLQKPHLFWFWLKNLYSSTITMELCKLIDGTPQCISLITLLKSLKDSNYLAECNFIKVYKSKKKSRLGY